MADTCDLAARPPAPIPADPSGDAVPRRAAGSIDAAGSSRSRIMGAGGLALARIAAQALQFGLFLYAARVLTTADFGVFSLAFAIIVGLSVVAEAGWREWVICAEDAALVDEAGAAALVTGGVIALAGLALIGLGQRLLLNPGLLMVAALLLPWVVARPLVCVQIGMLTRTGRLTHLAVVQWLAEAAGFVAGIALLHKGAGLAALAWAKLALAAVELGGYTLGVRRLPMARPARAHWIAMTRFSHHILSARLLAYFQGNLTTLVIGTVFAPGLVGIYRAAMRLGGTAQEVIREPARAVGWSWLRAALDQDGGSHGLRFAQAAQQFLDITITLGTALFLLLALESGAIVRLMLGARWGDAAPVLLLLALALIVRLPQVLAEPLFPLVGKPWLTRRLALMIGGIALVCFLVALRFGLVMVALGELVAALVTLGPLLWLLARHGGLRAMAMIRVISLALIASLATVALWLILPGAADAGGLHALLVLVRNGLALLAAHTATHLIVRRLIPAASSSTETPR